MKSCKMRTNSWIYDQDLTLRDGADLQSVLSLILWKHFHSELRTFDLKITKLNIRSAAWIRQFLSGCNEANLAERDRNEPSWIVLDTLLVAATSLVPVSLSCECKGCWSCFTAGFSRVLTFDWPKVWGWALPTHALRFHFGARLGFCLYSEEWWRRWGNACLCSELFTHFLLFFYLKSELRNVIVKHFYITFSLVASHYTEVRFFPVWHYIT